VPFKDPRANTAAGIDVGVTKSQLSVGKMMVAGFLAGAYIAFGGLVAISVSSGLDPKTWGTLPTLFTGSVFALGLVLTVVAGAELLTGNMAMVPLSAFRGRVSAKLVGLNFTVIFVANLLGSLFVAYFLAVKSGVVTEQLPLERLSAIAKKKAVEETDWQIFLRAVGCNWLVCLAVWMAMAAEDIAARSSRSSSRSWRSSPWASTTSWRTCSSSRRRSSRTSPASTGWTR
jgi:formate/nitrite transporter